MKGPLTPPPARLSSKPSDLLPYDGRDAQELTEFHEQSTTLPRRPSDASTHVSEASTGEEISAYSSHRVRLRPRTRAKWFDGLVRQWEKHVHIKVPAEKRRDHLALERTFLGYLRTSLALSMVGVIIAQLFRLQTTALPGGGFGYFVLAVPLAACFICGSIVVTVLGAIRFWKQQTAMARGTVWAGGWEMLGIMGTGILLCLATFVVILIAKDAPD